jgi:hypothetical protein
MSSFCSTTETPVSVSMAEWAFSSRVKSTSRRRKGMTSFTVWYRFTAPSAGPEMISGVRLSSMRMLSTSSTMA